MEEHPVALVLSDTIDVHTDEYGNPRDNLSRRVAEESERLVRQLSHVFGAPTESATETARRGRGRQYGGLDVLTEAREIVFALGGAGVSAGAIALAREWMRLKAQRRVSLKVKRENGTEVEVDVTGHPPETAHEIARKALEDPDGTAEVPPSR